MRKQKRVALVTGSTSGIGYAVARTLIESGYDLIAHYRSSTSAIPKLKRLAKQKRVSITFIAADFSDASSISACADEIVRVTRSIDAAVFCAGENEKKPYENLTEGDFARIFSINAGAPLILTQKLQAARVFRKNSSIITIGTPNGFIGGSLRNVLYTMSKTSLIGFTRTLAKAYAPHIRVNCIVPGFIETRMLTENTPSEELDRKRTVIPFKRFGTPVEIARVVRFLVSEDASYVTGQLVHVNGAVFLG